MGSVAEKKMLSMSDLENAVRVGNIQLAQHAFDNSNQGVGDVTRLEMLIPKLESLKEAPGKDPHFHEINNLIEGVKGRIEYLRGKG